MASVLKIYKKSSGVLGVEEKKVDNMKQVKKPSEEYRT